MTLRRCWMIATIGALASVALVLETPAAEPPHRATEPPHRAAEAAHGKQLYYRHGCFGCHGFNGETGARRLVGSPILATPETFVAFLRLRAGLTPLLPSTRMPSYPARALSDRDALDLYAYVRTFVLHAPDPRGITAFQKILESAKRPYKPSP